MVDRPILFSGPMVRALLDGSKTQTRRVLKPHPPADFVSAAWDAERTMTLSPASLAFSPFHVQLRRLYQPGDRLWVKESCADEHPLAIQEERYSQPGRAGIPGPPPVNYRTIYRVDGEPLKIWRSHCGHPYFRRGAPTDPLDAAHPHIRSNWNRPMCSKEPVGIYWTNARYMPRWASRLTLVVGELRVQRLHEISEADAIAEGVRPSMVGDGWWTGGDGQAGTSPEAAYALLWNSLNAKRGFGWNTNPWVAAVTFTTHRANIDALPESEAA